MLEDRLAVESRQMPRGCHTMGMWKDRQEMLGKPDETKQSLRISQLGDKAPQGEGAAGNWVAGTWVRGSWSYSMCVTRLLSHTPFGHAEALTASRKTTAPRYYRSVIKLCSTCGTSSGRCCNSLICFQFTICSFLWKRSSWEARRKVAYL